MLLTMFHIEHCLLSDIVVRMFVHCLLAMTLFFTLFQVTMFEETLFHVKQKTLFYATFFLDNVPSDIVINKKKDQTMLVLTEIKQINGRGEFAYFKNLNLYKVELINAVTSSN